MNKNGGKIKIHVKKSSNRIKNREKKRKFYDLKKKKTKSDKGALTYIRASCYQLEKKFHVFLHQA